MNEMSEDQQKIYDEIINKTKGCCLITGHAGTGKTFTAINIISTFLERGLKVNCIAPTHQAKNQLAGNLMENDRLKVRTLASLLSVKAKRSEVTGQIEFSEGDISKGEYHNQIFVIDECSMIGEEDLKKLITLKNDNLLIFLGDFHQLSPVLKKDGMAIYNKMKKYELVKQHRNAGPILQLCDHLRHSIKYPEKDEEGINVHNTKEDFLVDMILKIQSDPDPYNITYLAFTNKAVREVRALIHESIHGDEIISVGQYLRLESKTSIGNRSEIIEIISREHSKEVIMDETFDVYKIVAQNIFSGDETQLKILSYEDQDYMEEKLKEFYKESFELWGKIKAEKNKEKASFLEKQRKRIQEKIKSSDEITMVSSPFAMTVHKSQGTTIPTVFLDTENIRIMGRDMKIKLMYVGCSRSKTELNTIKVRKYF